MPTISASLKLHLLTRECLHYATSLNGSEMKLTDEALDFPDCRPVTESSDVALPPRISQMLQARQAEADRRRYPQIDDAK